MGIKLRRLTFFCYSFLSKNIITRRYIEDIRHIFEILKPTDESIIIMNTMVLYLKGIISSVFVLLFSLSIKGTSIYNYIIIFSLIFLFNHQIIQMSLGKEELKLLRQLEKYMGDVRHFYHKGGMVEEALYDSMEDAEYEISLHMGQIYELLVKDDKEEFEQYKEIAPNKYFTTFLALCQITIQYGDTIREDDSLFLSNLNHLKNEINVEILKREKLNHVFSGLIFMTIFPVFFLKAIENWGISNLPELERYYRGGYGIVVSVLIFLFTMISYSLICRLKGQSRVYQKKHPILEKISNLPFIKDKIQNWMFQKGAKTHYLNQIIRRASDEITIPQFLAQKVILFFGSFLAMILILSHIIFVSKGNTINYTGDFNGTSFISGTDELDHTREIIKELSKKYRKEDTQNDIETKLCWDLENQYKLKNDAMKLVLVEEIKKRIEKFHHYQFAWYYIPAILTISYFICNLPLFILKCKGYFIRMNMEDEVMQFQSIIIMLMYIERMNVHTILEWLENFSEIFRTSISECVDQFSYDEDQALRELNEKEPFLPLMRIIENLEACDQVGVMKAFDEIVGERNYYTEKRKQENEINLSNKGVIGRFLSYIPLILTIGLYLIIPFIMESINQLMGYMTQLQ